MQSFNTRRSSVLSTALVFTCALLLLTSTVSSQPISIGPAPINLGTAHRFAILAHTGVTNIPTSVITGDVGVSPTTGTSLVLATNQVIGSIFTVDAAGPAGSVASPAMLALAKDDLTLAFNDAASRTADVIGVSGNLGGMTLLPGLYKATTLLELSSGDLTFDGGGHSNAVWIIQVGTSFNVTGGRQMILTNGANAANIFWQVGTGATIAATAVLQGTFMAGTQITMAAGAILHGRALAVSTNVTLDQNVITNPGPVVATSIERNDEESAKFVSLSQNYPNPFNPSTVVGFQLSVAGQTSLKVYDLLGREVAVLVDGPMSAGSHSVTFDASALTSGVYMYRIVSEGVSASRQMILIK
jgi:hypothetical protein